MKDWIMELCPEIQEWQAELIAEQASNRDTAHGIQWLVKDLLETLDEMHDMERDRHPMFSEGYNYALYHISQSVNGAMARWRSEVSGDHNMHQKETPCLDNHEEKFQALWAEREKMWDEIVSLRGLLYQCLEAMENLHRTGDTQVFDMCVADTLLPVLRERLGVKECN